MSNMGTSNSVEIINKISDYIWQSNFQNHKEIDIVVKHDTLGNFRVNVNKMMNNENINLEILAETKDGQKFFADHEGSLLRNLSGMGLKIATFKVGPSGEFNLFDNESKDFLSNRDNFDRDSNNRQGNKHNSED